MTLFTRSGFAAGTAAILMLMGMGSAPASAAVPAAASLASVHLCVSSSVPEPSTLTWRYPEGTPSHWLDGRGAHPYCATGSAVPDRISAEAFVHFGGPTLHQTWEVLVDPHRNSSVLFEVLGPDGVGELEVLHLGDAHSYTSRGVTATISWVGNDGSHPRIRFQLAPAA